MSILILIMSLVATIATWMEGPIRLSQSKIRNFSKVRSTQCEHYCTVTESRAVLALTIKSKFKFRKLKIRAR